MKLAKLSLLSLFISFNVSCYEDFLEDSQELTSLQAVNLKEIARINLSDQNYTVCSRLYDDKSRNRVIAVLVSNNNKSAQAVPKQTEFNFNNKTQDSSDQYRAYDYNGNFLEQLPVGLSQTSDFAPMPGNPDLLIISCWASNNVLVWDLKNNKQYGVYQSGQTSSSMNRVAGLGAFKNLNLLVAGGAYSENRLFIWDLGKQDKPTYIADGHQAHINFIGKPDDINAQWFASSDGQGEIKTWDLVGNPIACFRIQPSSNPAITDPRNIIKFYNLPSSNNTSISTIACGTPGDIKIYDQFGKTKLDLVDLNNSQYLEPWNGQGAILSCASNRTMVWDALPQQSNVYQTFNGSLQNINSAKIEFFNIPGNAIVLTASGNSTNTPQDYSVRVWGTSGQVLAQSSDDPDVAGNIYYFGNGLFVVVAGSYLRFFQVTNSSDNTHENGKQE